MEVTLRFEQTNAPTIEAAAKATLDDLADMLTNGADVLMEITSNEDGSTVIVKAAIDCEDVEVLSPGPLD